ncbi:MAG: hypothetical protein GY804_08615 [Alphaproteobacteria bacterium]|nr:hypothetical protein [Alphaproteobacteria bacterium]
MKLYSKAMDMSIAITIQAAPILDYTDKILGGNLPYEPGDICAQYVGRCHTSYGQVVRMLISKDTKAKLGGILALSTRCRTMCSNGPMDQGLAIGGSDYGASKITQRGMISKGIDTVIAAPLDRGFWDSCGGDNNTKDMFGIFMDYDSSRGTMNRGVISKNILATYSRPLSVSLQHSISASSGTKDICAISGGYEKFDIFDYPGRLSAGNRTIRRVIISTGTQNTGLQSSTARNAGYSFGLSNNEGDISLKGGGLKYYPWRDYMPDIEKGVITTRVNSVVVNSLSNTFQSAGCGNGVEGDIGFFEMYGANKYVISTGATICIHKEIQGKPWSNSNNGIASNA